MQATHRHDNSSGVPRALIITSHPSADSLTVAAAKHAHEYVVRNGGKSCLAHLDAIGYDAAMPVDELARRFSFDEMTLDFQNYVQQCDCVGLFYPDWWGLPPAPLVGWMQRVLSIGVAFTLREQPPGATGGETPVGEGTPEFNITPRLTNTRVVQAVTSDNDNETDVTAGPMLLQRRLELYAGVRNCQVHALCSTRTAPPAVRTKWIETCARLVFGIA